MSTKFFQFLKSYYNPKLLLGTVIGNSALCAYVDTKYGVVKGSPIVEVCTETSHVFYGKTTTYGIDYSKIILGVIPASIIGGPITLPLHIYSLTTNKANQDETNYNECWCGKIKY